MAYIPKTNLCTKVPGSKALNLGATIIVVRWGEISKGDAVLEKRPSRFAANDDRPDLFAAAPPLDALAAITFMCAGGSNGRKIMGIDVSMADFSAPSSRQVFVELPDEDKVEGENRVG